MKIKLFYCLIFFYLLFALFSEQINWDNLEKETRLYTHIKTLKTLNKDIEKAVTISSSRIKQLKEQFNNVKDQEILSIFYYLFAKIHIKKGQLEKAEIFLLKADEEMPQNTLEFEKEELWKYSFDFFNSIRKYRKAFFYVEKLVEFYRKEDNQEKLAINLKKRGLISYNLKKYNQAKNDYKEAIDIGKKIKNKSVVASCYNNLGTLNEDLEKYKKALENYFSALDMYSNMGNSFALSVVHSNIANTYSQINEDDLALKHLKKSLETSKNSKNKIYLSSCYNNLGNYYLRKNKLNKALENYNKSLKYINSEKNLESYGKTLLNIGIVYFKMNKPREAIETYEQSLNYLKNERNLIQAYKALTEIYNSIGDIEKSELFLDKLKKIFEENKDNLQLKSDYLFIKSKVLNSKKQFKKAYSKLYESFELNDSLKIVNTEKKLEKLRVRYDTIEKEREIELLKENQELISSELQKMKIIRILLIVIIFLILIILIFIYNRNKIIKKLNNSLKEKNQELTNMNERLQKTNATKDRFFSIVAHDLKNSIHAFTGFLSLINQQASDQSISQIRKDISELEVHSANVAKLLENLLEWARTQTGNISYQPTKFNINTELHQIIELFTPNAAQKNIKLVYSGTDLFINADKEMIKTVCRNLINNAIKFTNKGGKITVTSEKMNDNLKITVADNGIGMSKETLNKLFKADKHISITGTNKEKGTGLGLLLCRELLSYNNGEIKVYSELGVGSEFVVYLNCLVDN